MVQPQTGQYMLVVCRDSGPDMGAHFPRLQPVERPAESPQDSGQIGDGLESWQMPTHADLSAVFHGSVQSSCNILLRGY